jgi:membrane protein implicated in regulation of membrane protease activity
MANISFQYPSWYLLFCLALGLAYALVLYYKDRAFPEQVYWLRWLLGGLRFVLVSLIAILLLTPLLKRMEREVKKPVIVLAQDGSESIGEELKDEEKARYQQAMESLGDQLGDEYELKTYTFGSDVRQGLDFSFEDKSTNIADMLSTAYDLYSNQNLGAVILATDGIFNEGSSPVYTSTKLGAPVYTVALGDTTPRRDLVVKRVFHNRIAYLGDKFSVQIDLLADNAVNTNSRINIYKVEGGSTQLLEQQAIPINSNRFFTTREVILDANQAGVQRYRVVFSPVEGEVSTKNNSKDIFIDVLDARQKVLIVGNSPHPDITALRQALTSNKNYEVTVDYAAKPVQNVEAFDFVILHQIPSRLNDASGLLNTLQQKRIPHLFVVGTQTNLARLNQVQPLLTVQGSGDNTNEVQARVNTGFSLFTLSDELKSELMNFAPVVAPFGEYTSSNGEVLLYQRIGKVDTQYPLCILGERDQVKVGVFSAEGIWKWRLFDYLQHQNHQIFNELVTKIVQYLSLKEDKRRFRVNLSKNIFDENEAVYLDAELYNESFELVNQPDVSISISDSQGKEYNYTFTKTGNAYTLNAGVLPVGDYRFSASTLYNGENFSFNGQFSVQPIQLESYAMTADHNMLKLLSQKFGGGTFSPSSLTQLADQIKQQDTLKPVIYETAKTRPVINLKWLFFLLLALLTTEWFLRRYFGAY